MKVILLQDVAKIGRRHSIVEVPDGYALNQLIPKKLAEPALPANLKKIEKLKADSAASADAAKRMYQDAIATLKGKEIVVVADANEQGHLFKAVSVDDVVLAVKNAGVTIDARSVTIQSPIKELGQHEIPLVHAGVSNQITISVVKK